MMDDDDDDDDDDADADADADSGGAAAAAGGGGGKEEMVVQLAKTIVLRKAHPDDPVPFCIAGAPRFCMWPVCQDLCTPS